VKGLLAYYYGLNIDAGVVPVTAEHIRVNDGFTIPRLTGWFTEDAKVTTGLIVSDEIRTNSHPTKFFVICAQSIPHHTPGPATCQLLVFRKAVFGGSLVNFRNSDVLYMKDVIKWYVCNKTPQSASKIFKIQLFPMIPSVPDW
jgi:hypothetical protein